MGSVRIVEELFVTAPTRVGLLADLAQRLASEGVAIHAIGAYDKEGQGEFMLITADNTAAASALRDAGMDVERKDVVMVTLPDQTGSLAVIARQLADAGINVDWVYATTADGAHANVILKGSDPERIARVLEA